MRPAALLKTTFFLAIPVAAYSAHCSDHQRDGQAELASVATKLYLESSVSKEMKLCPHWRKAATM